MDASSLISAALDELLTPGTKLSDILQRIKAIAHFINNHQLKQWANLELNGYIKTGVQIPDYRIIGVLPKVNLLHEEYTFNKGSQSNMDMITEYLDKDLREALTTKYVGNSISEIELIASKDENPTISIPHLIFQGISEKIYQPNGWYIHRAWQIVPATQMAGVLTAVRSKLLDLLLELDQLDKDVSLQSLKGKQAAVETVSKALNSSITVGAGGIVNLSHGDNSTQAANTGNAAHVNTASGHTVTQSTNAQGIDGLKDFIEQLSQHVANDAAFDTNREELEQQIATVKVQLQKSEPKKSIIKRAIESITELAADGAGVMAGHAVFELLKQAPHLLTAAGIG